jgi:glycosyltransferase involved in cell wall biosynthesis
MVGRLAPMKGHVRVLRALCAEDAACRSLLDKTRQDWCLTIAGEGPCKDEIEASVQELKLCEQVEMLGTVADVRSVYQAADLFVLASDYEGLPNTLIEALACGCRVLVVDGDGGTTEFMQSLGLEAFVFKRETFERSFWSCVQTVLEADASVWHQAYQTLVKKVSPGCVADQIWEFANAECSSLRTL